MSSAFIVLKLLNLLDEKPRLRVWGECAFVLPHACAWGRHATQINSHKNFYIIRGLVSYHMQRKFVLLMLYQSRRFFFFYKKIILSLFPFPVFINNKNNLYSRILLNLVQAHKKQDIQISNYYHICKYDVNL